MERLKKIDEIREILNELRELGAELKENFSALEKLIDKEEFPKNDFLEYVGENLSDLNHGISDCFDIYDELFEADKPRTFPELEKILNAEEKKIHIANTFGQAEKFLLLISNNPDVQKSLTKYQKLLKSLLGKKSRDAKAKAAVEPYAKFIGATAETDFGKKFAVGKELSEFFGDDFIGRAFFGNELSFKDDKEDSKPEIVAELPSEKVDFEKILREKDAFLSIEAFDPFKSSYKIENNCRNEITVKKLRKDFKERWFSKETRHVLIHAALDGCFSIEMILETVRLSSASDLENAAEILLNKGYIQRYTLDKLGSFYTSTKEFFTFIRKDNSKEFFKIFPPKTKSFKRKFGMTADFLSDGITFAFPRAVFLHLLSIEATHKNNFNGITLLAQSFQADFAGRNGTDLIIGCFWGGAEEQLHFLDELKEFLDEKNFDRLIVTGLDIQHANKIFDAFDAALTEEIAKVAALYIYSVEDENFYLRNSDEKISQEKIWSKTSPENESPDEDFFDDELSDEESPDEKFSNEEAPKEEFPEEKTSDEEISEDEFSDEEDFEEENFLDAPFVEKLKAFNEMLFAKKFYCAAAYLKALSLQEATYESLYRQAAYALNDPLLSASYGSDKIISLFNESETPDENFLTAATFDYDMKNLHGIVKNFEVVENNSPLAELIFALMNFKEAAKNGADYYADYRVKDRSKTEKRIAKLSQEAKTFLDRIKNFKEKANNPRFIETKKILLNGSELTNYLEYAAEETFDEETLPLLKNYLLTTFIREGETLGVENIDVFKFDGIIDAAWEEAGNNIRRKKNMNLVGELRSNLSNLLKKAIEILCERVNCFEESAPLQSDAGALEYKKIRAGLLDKIAKAQKILSENKTAGSVVLIETLQEISDKLKGNFDPVRHKYFYADFLRGNRVLLDENYLPNFGFNTLDGTNSSIAARIVSHSRAKLPTFADRIKNIFEDRGWDFGTAQLIDAYLEEVEGKSIIEQNKYELQKSVEAVNIIALTEKKKFFGFLELAQSYGQFDAAPENAKEKILKIIDRCFEFAQKTENLGIFFRVKKYWENKTKADAAKYAPQVERDLEIGIKNYCLRTNEPADSPALQKSIERIRKMIERRNYTVAQGRINHLGEDMIYSEPSEQTHLQRFLENYRDYFDRVSKTGESLKKLVGKNQKFSKAETSKGIKGGEILIDNWLPNGFPQNGDIGEDRLEKLLNALGFKVAGVKKSGAINKDALNYSIKLLPPANGQSSNYSHPISAFGSNAEIYGFRVTCLFGTYNADGLIKIFKEIGDAENTLVLLDYALELPTRRSLARKIKAESSVTKIFAVVDRVLIMYLIKNYDKMQINKMLMSLTMPFARCQPYVFNPNVPIPPEIFIGRERELRRILNFDDVNIVYGGRQLGKTALLKMACASLDRNENNDRAVFVDVNKCDCAAAALKISRALREKNFFDETFSATDDWTELASAIKKRLASDEPNKIPHFMLALDEADDFIKNCREIDFKPVLELIDIQQQPHNGSRFKFVMRRCSFLQGRFSRQQQSICKIAFADRQAF